MNELCGSDWASNEAFGTSASADNCNGEQWDYSDAAGPDKNQDGETRRGGGDSMGMGYDVYRLVECHPPPVPRLLRKQRLRRVRGGVRQRGLHVLHAQRPERLQRPDAGDDRPLRV